MPPWCADANTRLPFVHESGLSGGMSRPITETGFAKSGIFPGRANRCSRFLFSWTNLRPRSCHTPRDSQKSVPARPQTQRKRIEWISHFLHSSAFTLFSYQPQTLTYGSTRLLFPEFLVFQPEYSQYGTIVAESTSSIMTMKETQETTDAEVGATEQPEASNKKAGFFSTSFLARRRNRWLLGSLLGLIIVLIVLVPTLKVVGERHERDRSGLANLNEKAGTYAIVKTNFPDPTLIEVNGSYYAFATRSPANISCNVQAAKADSDISRWTLLEDYDTLPSLPPWVKKFGDAGVWAPQVNQRPDGVFIMVYSALHKDHPRKHCLGVATSKTVLGPYDPGNSTEPLVCHLQLGGIIDPTYLEDPLSNNTYLIYKNDGNAIGSGGACANGNWPNTPTTFEYNIMDPATWSTFQDSTLAILASLNESAAIVDYPNNSSIFLQNNKVDGSNIEAPFARYQEYPATDKRPARRAYHMLYNSGCFANRSYRIEHVVCWLDDAKNITSFTDCPWQDLKQKSAQTLLKTGNYKQPDGRPAAELHAPGGPAVSGDGRYMAFHADIMPDWFDGEDNEKIGGEGLKRDINSTNEYPNSINGTTSGYRNGTASAAPGPKYRRQRALFLAELEWVGDDDRGLRIKGLVMP